MVNKIENNDMTEVMTAKAALVDFNAVWCGPCKMLAPIIEELSEEMKDSVAFFSLDTDQNMDTAMAHRISSIPCLLLFKDGQVVARTVGFQPKEAIREFIEANL